MVPVPTQPIGSMFSEDKCPSFTTDQPSRKIHASLRRQTPGDKGQKKIRRREGSLLRTRGRTTTARDAIRASAHRSRRSSGRHFPARDDLHVSCTCLHDSIARLGLIHLRRAIRIVKISPSLHAPGDAIPHAHVRLHPGGHVSVGLLVLISMLADDTLSRRGETQDRFAVSTGATSSSLPRPGCVACGSESTGNTVSVLWFVGQGAAFVSGSDALSYKPIRSKHQRARPPWSMFLLGKTPSEAPDRYEPAPS